MRIADSTHFLTAYVMIDFDQAITCVLRLSKISWSFEPVVILENTCPVGSVLIAVLKVDRPSIYFCK